MNQLDLRGQRARSLYATHLANTYGCKQTQKKSHWKWAWISGPWHLEVKSQGHYDLKFYEHNISRMHRFASFVEFGANLHLELRMNWLNFEGQISLKPHKLWGRRLVGLPKKHPSPSSCPLYQGVIFTAFHSFWLVLAGKTWFWFDIFKFLTIIESECFVFFTIFNQYLKAFVNRPKIWWLHFGHNIDSVVFLTFEGLPLHLVVSYDK